MEIRIKGQNRLTGLMNSYDMNQLEQAKDGQIFASGKITSLNNNNDMVGKEVHLIYSPLREIEGDNGLDCSEIPYKISKPPIPIHVTNKDIIYRLTEGVTDRDYDFILKRG